MKITVTKTELAPLIQYQKYLKKIWDASWVTNNGQFLVKFENKLKKLFKTENILVVSNGTLAIQLALKVLPQKTGEIITTPFTFQATTNCIVWEGYSPVFADIDPETFNIDPKDVEKKITPKTVAILAVHVYGNACDIEKLQSIAKKHKIHLIYDAAHAFDVVYKNKQLATYGDISTLSFHATKTFHSIEGGAIICRNSQILHQLKLLRNFGIKSEEEVISCGINAKMNELQASMGLLNLTYLKQRYAKRKKIYQYYMRKLHRIDGISYQRITVEKENYTYLPIVLRSKRIRDFIYNEMKKNGIGTRKYFYPLTTNAKFLKPIIAKKSTNYTPVAKNISDRILCIPMYASLTYEDVDMIIGHLNNLLNKIPRKV